ncbi:MAG TPA: ferric reductase-like transmembrane domain-containing protein [Candidatus Angelobacter sp.]|jgi:sulfoxide reductase heme-binding subunit YedZ|nr:ferric reductase-like transmembrane domain-containing protein [Candidatus Angelobacter sp.]
MNTGLVLWEAARAAALAAFAVLAAALVTGMAVRTQLLGGLATSPAVLALHSFLSWFWVPLVAVHVTALILDGTSRLTPLDAAVPFRAPYAQVPIGLGTIGLLILVLVGVTSAFRRRMSARAFRVVHRAAYPMFAVFLVHAQLAGTDFSRTWISVLGWATLGALAVLALVRLAAGRLKDQPSATTALPGVVTAPD